MSGEKIFITGANGCVGHVLARRLLEQGFEVTALALDKRDTGNLAGLRLDIEFGDICDSQRMTEIFDRHRFDVVIHLAALVHSPGAPESLYRKVNRDATALLVDLSRQTSVRQFIFISTVAVFGDRTEGVLNEEDLPRPITPYGISKLEAERYVQKNAGQGLDCTIIRPTTVYGPHDRGNIQRLFRLARKGIVPVPGNGENQKSFVYSGNLAEGIGRTILNPTSFGEVFILSDRQPYTLNEILSQMGEALNKRVRILHLPKAPLLWMLKFGNRILRLIMKKEPLPVGAVEKISTPNVFSINKARKVLGYEPSTSLLEGLKCSYLKEENR
jgi:nucleoside-diphosphate-sugar epimerase